MSTKRPSLLRVLSETSRIISARPRHFLALSALFLFPISFPTTIYPFLSHPTSVHSRYHQLLSSFSTPDFEIPPAGESQFAIQILYSLFVLIFYLFAVSSITCSTFHEFLHQPVEFVPSLKSILNSFFPLLVAKLFTTIILGLIFKLLPYTVLVLLGFNMDYKRMYFMVFIFLIAALLVGLLVYVGVDWCLMNPIVLESQWGFPPLERSSYFVKGMRGVVFMVMMFFGSLSSGILSIWFANLMANYAGALLVGLLIYLGVEWSLIDPIVLESQWGFAPLKRSSYLVKAMRGVVILTIMFFGVLSGILSLWYANLMANYAGNISEGRTGWVILQMVVYAGFSTILSLYNLVADTVLFVYCKSLRGESSSQIDEKLGGDYFRLHFDI